MVDRQSVRGFLQDSSDHTLTGWIDPVEELAVTSSGLDYKIEVDDKGWVGGIGKIDNELELMGTFASLESRVRYELVLSVCSDCFNRNQCLC